MQAFRSRLQPSVPGALALVFTCLLAFLALHQRALAEVRISSLIPYLEDRFELSEGQVKGALGALLVFARNRLPKPEFDQLAERVPDPEHIMQQVKLQGIVTRPLRDREDYEKALSSLGIGPTIASQFAPAVIEYLGALGFSQERDMLARILD